MYRAVINGHNPSHLSQMRSLDVTGQSCCLDSVKLNCEGSWYSGKVKANGCLETVDLQFVIMYMYIHVM